MQSEPLVRDGMAVVPDTLDLTDRAVLGINGLLGTTDSERDYEPYFLPGAAHPRVGAAI
jgi:hypothetical protein